MIRKLKHMSYIFISHSTVDDKLVNEIQRFFQKYSLKTWIDHLDIFPGDNWNDAIQKALQNCYCGLLILSSSSYNRLECINEWRTILDLGKSLYVILVEPLPADKYPYRLRTTQYVDLTQGFDKAMDNLVISMEQQTNLAQHTINYGQKPVTLSSNNLPEIGSIMKSSSTQYAKITDKSSEPTNMTITIETEFDKFTSDKAQEITKFIAMLSGLGIHQIRIVDINEGSVKLRLEMPRDAADNILKIAQNNPELLAQYGITEAELNLTQIHPSRDYTTESLYKTEESIYKSSNNRSPVRIVEYHLLRLKDKNSLIRLAAIRELALLASPASLDALREVFETDEDEDVRKAAQKAGREIFTAIREAEKKENGHG